jgi:hypothetical protein
MRLIALSNPCAKPLLIWATSLVSAQVIVEVFGHHYP